MYNTNVIYIFYTPEKTTINLSIAEIAHAVDKSENYVRQHIHRKHLNVQKDGYNVSVAIDEVARWARKRGLPFELPPRTLLSTGTLKERTARDDSADMAYAGYTAS